MTDEADAIDGADPDRDPFAADRPERRLTGGSVEYVGETVFALRPETPAAPLEEAVTAALAAERWIAGDWFDLPATVYLVRDTRAGESFRVAVRAEVVELHALPDTGTGPLRAFKEQLSRTAETSFSVETVARP